MNTMVPPMSVNPHTANARQLTASQKEMLLAISDSDKRDKIILLLMNPERFLDLCWLIHFQFVKLEQDADKQLTATISLPGLYARGLILRERD